MNKMYTNPNDTRSLAQDWIRSSTVSAAAKPVVEALETRTLMFAPSGMSAAGTSESSVTLHWTDNASTETHFIVDRSVDGTRYKRIGSVPANSTSFPDTGLQPGTTYHYRVKAITTTVNSGWSRVSGSTLTTVATTAPAAPSAFTAESTSPTTMNLSWSDNADNETHALIERSTDGVKWRRFASVGADVTSFVDSGLTPGVEYQYRIRTVNGVGGSKWVRSSATTAAPPAAPSGLVATALSQTQLQLNWSDNASNETHFIIDRSTDGINYSRVASLSADSNTFTDEGLNAGTGYYYSIKSVNEVGASNWVRTIGTTQSPPALISEDFSSGSGNFTTVDGTWGASGGSLQISGVNEAGTSHLNNRVVHVTSVDGDFTLDVDASAASGSSEWSDFGVIFGYQDPQNYYFFSSNQSNDAFTSGLFKVVGGEVSQLADVSGAIAVGQSYHLRVVREGDRIDGYRDGTLVATATDSTFTAGQLGLGAKSNGATFDNFTVVGTVLPPPPEPNVPPTAPSGLSATAASSSKIDLAWLDNSNDETGFKIERSTDGSTWAQVGSVGAGVKAYSATALAAETTYQFRVSAYNSVGHSDYSQASATTSEAPVAGARPGPDNTGPTRPDLLVPVVSVGTTHDGQIIENVDIGPNARINVNHSNVTIRNFRINAGSQANAINVAIGVTNLVIEDGEIIGSNGHAIYGHHWTARRLNMHHMGSDAMLPFSNVTVEGCWIHHLGMTVGSHADGVQVGWGGDAANGRYAENFVFRGNYFDMPIPLPGTASNAALFINPYNGDQKLNNMLIENNWFNGGNYTIYILGNSTNVVIRNNFFGRNYRYGVKSIYAPDVVWENNRWMDNNELIP